MSYRSLFSLATMAIAALTLQGCASIVNDANIPITVSFSDGSEGDCTFRNKRGVWRSDIPTDGVMIRRSDDPLTYDCETEDGREAVGSIRSEMEGEKLAASVVFFDLGITDAITDKHRTYQGNVVIPLRARKPDKAADSSSASEDINESEPTDNTSEDSEL
ncbi:MAG: hypothetical protein RIC29_06510 [Rhodospirillaceae bacterium]